MFTIAFYAVLGAAVIGFSVRSWRRTVRSRRPETPEQFTERRLREYEQGPTEGARSRGTQAEMLARSGAAVRAVAALDVEAATSP